MIVTVNNCVMMRTRRDIWQYTIEESGSRFAVRRMAKDDVQSLALWVDGLAAPLFFFRFFDHDRKLMDIDVPSR